MAEIDKGLPNVRRNVTLPSQDELTEVQTAVQETIPSHEGTEITENEDGSVNVDFEYFTTCLDPQTLDMISYPLTLTRKY